MTLKFWREYCAFAHLGNDWSVHEATVRCTVARVEATLIASAPFQILNKRVFQEEQIVQSFVAVDASEVPCERPEKAGRPHTGAVLPKTAAHTEVPAARLYRDAADPGHSDKCWGGP